MLVNQFQANAQLSTPSVVYTSSKELSESSGLSLLTSGANPNFSSDFQLEGNEVEDMSNDDVATSIKLPIFMVKTQRERIPLIGGSAGAGLEGVEQA